MIKTKTILILFFFVFVPVALLGQTGKVGSITMEDGLSGSSVKTIFRDCKGYMYFGTSVGVDRYDGTNIVNIGFPIKNKGELCWVSGIVEEDAEHLIVGNNAGLWRLDKRKLTITRIFQDDIDWEITSIVRSPDRTIYIGTVRGLFALKDGKITHLHIFSHVHSSDGNVRDLALYHTAKGNVLWVAMSKGVVAIRLSANKGGAFFRLYNSEAETEVRKIAVSRTGRVFVGTDRDGLYEYLPHSSKYVRYIIANEPITDLQADMQGHLLVSTATKGVLEVMLRNGTVVRCYTNKQVPGGVLTRYNNPFCFYRDVTGTDWIGYLFFGIDHTYYTRNIFRSLYFSNIDNSMLSYSISGDHFLLGSRSGLYVEGIHHQAMPVDGETFANVSISQIIKAGNMYFIGTLLNGAYMLDGKTLQVKNTPGLAVLRRENVYVIADDGYGSVWLCTTGGLVKYMKSSGQVQLFTPRNSQLPDDEVFCMAFDANGTGWISTRGGLCIYRPDIRTITTQGISSRISALGMLRQIVRDGVNLYFIPQHGMPLMFNVVTGKIAKVNLHITEDAPAIGLFKKVAENVYLFSTENGFFMSDHGRVRGFGYIDGIPSLRIMSRNLQVDSSNRLWIASEKGLVYFRYKDAIRKKNHHIPIVITAIQTDHWYDHAEVNDAVFDNKIVLSRHNNDVSLTFTPLVYSDIRGMQFRYRLEGYEDEWHIAGHEHQIFYRSLSPGDYQLQIEVVGMPEISAAIAVSVPVTYSTMMRWLLIFIIIGLAAHVAYCRHYHKEYLWERFLPKPEKYQKSKMDKNEGEKLARQLLKYMDDKKPYLKSNIQMSDLARMLGCSTHTLSQLFSTYLNRNYYDFIAEYRINEFKRLAVKPEYAKYTITALSELCGFKSRNPFLTAFKKFTGVTPKEFMRTTKKNS